MSERSAVISKRWRKPKHKKIEEFESNTDDDDDIIVEDEEIEEEEEVGDGEKNNDKNEGESIRFEEEKANIQPSTEFLAMDLSLKSLCLQIKMGRLLASGLLAYIWLKKKFKLICCESMWIIDDKGGLPTYLKIDCLEKKIGVSDSHSETRKVW